MNSCQNPGGFPFGSAPVYKAKQSHQEQGFRIGRNEKKGSGMSEHTKDTKSLCSRRQTPTLTEEQKVTPKSPCRGLCGHQQCGVGLETKSITKRRRQEWISGEKGHVGNFHDLVINGWN